MSARAASSARSARLLGSSALGPSAGKSSQTYTWRLPPVSAAFVSTLPAVRPDAHRFGLVVIDPVRAFTDPAGVIGQIYPDQFSGIVETVERLASFAATQSGPKVWVTSLYAPGQFSGGDLDHPLAQLCTDASGTDCAWDPRLLPPADALVVTKT